MQGSGWLVPLWGVTLSTVMAYVSKTVPEMVMDEVFHVPQTQQYCRGDWTAWDKKITTLPGTYIIGAAYGALMQLAGLGSCSLLVLRTLNVALGIACLVATLSILRLQWPQARSLDTAAMAVALCMLPTHFFFQFLFYTDVAGLLFLLISFERSLRQQWAASAAAAAAAIMCRQTNVVWAAFTCGAAVLREASASTGDAQDLASTVQWIFTERRHVFHIAGGYAGVVAAFSTFAVVNGGIVVGDHDAHTPVLHAAQLPYALLFTVVAFLPLCFAESALLEDVRRAGLTTAGDVVFYTSVAAAAVLHGTVAHPYLLADNRHYTFYLWKDLLGPSPALRLALAPAYGAAAHEVSARFARKGGTLLAAGFLACAAAALLPAGLLEFRYFTVPALLFAMHIRPPHWRVSIVQALCFAAVNAVTLYVLCDRPFAWPDGSVARFMW